MSLEVSFSNAPPPLPATYMGPDSLIKLVNADFSTCPGLRQTPFDTILLIGYWQRSQSRARHRLACEPPQLRAFCMTAQRMLNWVIILRSSSSMTTPHAVGGTAATSSALGHGEVPRSSSRPSQRCKRLRYEALYPSVGLVLLWVSFAELNVCPFRNDHWIAPSIPETPYTTSLDSSGLEAGQHQPE